METSRDDSARACTQCGTALPDRDGGGRRADYCSRACQAKAYRARLAHRQETSRDETGWAALTARAVAAEAEAASLRGKLAAAHLRVDKLAHELEALRASASGAALPESKTAPARGALPALPPQIRLSMPRVCEQVDDTAWAVRAGDVSIGNIRLLTGKYWPTLPNGFEVYLGGAAATLEDAADKLARAYNGWANYWHGEETAKLTLLRPQRDGARTVKWGGQAIGKVSPATAAGYGGEGFFAITPKNGTLRVQDQGPLRFDDEQHAVEALLKRWRTDNPPPWGGLVAADDPNEQG